MQQKPLSAIRSTMSYGTCSYGWSAVAGFIIGTVIFLAGVAILPGADSNDPGYTYSVLLPMLAAITGASMGLAVICAAAFNYFEGRRIQWERELFSGPELPPPLPLLRQWLDDRVREGERPVAFGWRGLSPRLDEARHLQPQRNPRSPAAPP
jgi:hypothetical protein